MGKVLPFIPRRLAEYPWTTDALDPAECVLLVAIRWWVADIKEGNDPHPRLRRGMEIAGAPDAAYSVDHFMRVLARTARRQIDVFCPHCPRLSRDEQCLLHAASLLQTNEAPRAEAALRADMLTGEGAEFAVGPLEGLGELFAEADLRFRRRAPPADADVAGIEAWVPAGTPLH